MMKLAFSNLTAPDLRGRSLGELLVHIEADVALRDAERLIYTERLFPVAELAVELTNWVEKSRAQDDFHFKSLSFDEEGAVKIVRTPDGWSAGSIFHPGLWTQPVVWAEARSAVFEFVTAVRRGIVGLGIDASFIPGLPGGYLP